MFFVVLLVFLWPSLNTLPISVKIPFPRNFKSSVPVPLLYRTQGDPSQHPCHEPFIAAKGAVLMTQLIISQAWCRRCQTHCWRTRIIWTLLFEMERCQGLQTKSPVNWLMIFHFFSKKMPAVILLFSPNFAFERWAQFIQSGHFSLPSHFKFKGILYF